MKYACPDGMNLQADPKWLQLSRCRPPPLGVQQWLTCACEPFPCFQGGLYAAAGVHTHTQLALMNFSQKAGTLFWGFALSCYSFPPVRPDFSVFKFSSRYPAKAKTCVIIFHSSVLSHSPCPTDPTFLNFRIDQNQQELQSQLDWKSKQWKVWRVTRPRKSEGGKYDFPAEKTRPSLALRFLFLAKSVTTVYCLQGPSWCQCPCNIKYHLIWWKLVVWFFKLYIDKGISISEETCEYHWISAHFKRRQVTSERLNLNDWFALYAHIALIMKTLFSNYENMVINVS